MKNSERFTTAKERTDAFWKRYTGQMVPYDAVEAFATWLDLEAEEEDPLPCPFCGFETECSREYNGLFRVKCIYPECWYSANLRKTREEAIASHNQVARAAKENKSNDDRHLDADHRKQRGRTRPKKALPKRS